MKGSLTKNDIPARVQIVERATSNTPQTTQAALFTVSGRVKILDITGEVTTILEAGANNLKLIANPTVGADVDICAAVDTDTDAVGTLYNITGTLADAMIPTTSGAFEGQTTPITVAAGTIDLDATASKTGQIKWTIQYVALDAGSTIVTA